MVILYLYVIIYPSLLLDNVEIMTVWRSICCRKCCSSCCSRLFFISLGVCLVSLSCPQLYCGIVKNININIKSA